MTYQGEPGTRQTVVGEKAQEQEHVHEAVIHLHDHYHAPLLHGHEHDPGKEERDHAEEAHEHDHEAPTGGGL